MAENLPEYVDYPPEMLAQVRQELTQQYESDPSSMDKSHYEKILSDNVLLNRYIRRKRGDPVSSVPFLVEVLKWWKRMDISSLNEKSFPKEYYELGGIHVYREDKDGNVMVYSRVKLFQRIAATDLLKKFTVYTMMKADEIALSKGTQFGWVLVYDCTGAGLSNADMDMSNFVISTLRNYFPHGQRYLLIHNLPWLLNAIKNVVFTMLPSNVVRRIKSSNSKTILDYVSVENLPPFLGGICPDPYPVVPNGLSTTLDFLENGTMKMSDEDWDKTKVYYKKMFAILEAEKETKPKNSKKNNKEVDEVGSERTI